MGEDVSAHVGDPAAEYREPLENGRFEDFWSAPNNRPKKGRKAVRANAQGIMQPRKEYGAGGGARTLTALPPTDFRTSYGFRRRQARPYEPWRLWSGLSLHRSGFGLGTARPVSTPSRFPA